MTECDELVAEIARLREALARIRAEPARASGIAWSALEGMPAPVRTPRLPDHSSLADELGVPYMRVGA